MGETGGKDFILVHPSANPDPIVANLIRGAFEYQGQKCSAASRAYLPKSLWPGIKEDLLTELKTVKVGPVDDFTNFVNAVIDERAFDKITKYITIARDSDECDIIAGGTYDKEKGYFIDPTVVVTTNPNHQLMEEEIFGPVLTIFVYDDADYDKTVDLVDSTSPYALTGAIFAKDRYVVEETARRLRHAAGNFYIHDKPTGAVVGQQPFGGSRGSGTNDKAGSIINMYRWVSARAIKENFVPVNDYRYPFLKEE